MSPEKQRIAIAEACGWKHSYDADRDVWDWYRPNGTYAISCLREESTPQSLPDYLNDLNAMHQAVETLRIPDDRWSSALMRVIQDDPAWTKGAVEARYATAKATATQRCEALLRTIGKWEEST